MFKNFNLLNKTPKIEKPREEFPATSLSSFSDSVFL
jgi:hypothetical protein